MNAPFSPLADPLDTMASAPLNRREALRLLGVALAAGVAGCKPAEDIVPLVTNPTGLPAGEPLAFATSLPLGGYGRGALGISVEGRPIKVSGNALHPASLGATDLFAEAEILGLYDPDRSRTLLKDGAISNWEALLAELRPRRAAFARNGGEGLGVLTGRITSPTLLRQIAELRQAFPQLRHYRHEPLGDDNARAGSLAAFGRRLDVLPHLTRADVVLCLGADPLGPGPAQIRNAKGFSARRRVRGDNRAMQRLYVVESASTLTGHAADHRLALSPARLRDFAASLAARFGAGEGERPNVDAGFLGAVEADLKAAGRQALVLVGEEQPPEIHALGFWLNHQLGNFGTTLDLIESVDPVEEGHGASIGALAADIEKGQVDTLFVLDCNPVYDGPGDLDFSGLLRRVPFALHLGLYRDETAYSCRWHVPESHPLEAWGDIRAVDGTAGIVQPLIRPLYATRTASELLAALGGNETPDPRAILRETWARAQVLARDDFENWWLRTVEAGVVEGSASPAVPPPRAPSAPVISAGESGEGVALLIHADPTIYDGRFNNNAWLQECPKPGTHLTWGNALRIGEKDAARLGIAAGDAVRIEHQGRHLEAPVLLDKGMAEGAVALSLGYGREKTGAIGIGLGSNAYALRRADALWVLSGVSLSRVGTSEPLPLTQFHLTEEGRDLAPEMTLADLAGGKRLRPSDDPPPSFYGGQVYEKTDPGETGRHAWAMVIDTGACIGCNACVIACQSENNVPVVGPDEIRANRSMHWLRIDSYEKPEDENRTVFQPVPCMHCEKAPCEPVCPVGASVHDHEGLNVQVYNRCIGTRFCQANCPYKVRRFNFFGYAAGQEYANLGAEPLQARFNPDVTVRGRGVMEKCTYCVQRIAGARQKAEGQGRPMADGEVVTACAAACPTEAIRFGDLAVEGSGVRTLRGEPQHYALLEEVGTRPRTTYLAKVRNTNPALEGEGEL
ncbi:4Fe-4S dicluster domain-containing protein [Aureimonas psammosilenae]|uniref:4Fe-4S dicluster domain-containing protein n=1 Tax=Aureimonas psammosilenae TaxID=2495496 RepID=UPI001F3F4B87|nr:4Fe-4S dicluster domain-containing protein [Aureimonas psammosilenae]